MIETGINWMQAGSNGAFLSESIKSMVQGFASVLKSVSWLFIALIISFLLVIVKKDLVQGIFIFFTLFLIEYMGIWSEAMDTMSLVVFSTFFALLLGIPQGILAAFSKGFNSFITPVLDFMQTMPAFVYLIPAVAFFGLGEGPAVFATLIFAIPPCIRLTALGIKQINPEFVEAADSFGSTKLQKLIKIQIPNALPTIMAGINQTIMLSLSMVVIASMVGTGGLGKIVFQAVNQLQLGNGFEGGIAVVIVAIILDKITQSIKH
ncbi:MAG: ABC transporter permease subunit [Spirochaetales bacterium]|nr:ABC transporter permease subunit [Spirochaetales bacterium]